MRARCADSIRACAVLALTALTACGEPAPGSAPGLLGRPGGPYELRLTLDPAPPVTTRDTRLSFALTRAQAAVSDLQIVHERALHTFIVARDFSSFAHLHHEDFAPLAAADVAQGRFHFPYRFPHGGPYLIVSEFVHRDRSWSKRFDLQVNGAAPAPLAADLGRERTVGAYTARLAISPPQAVAGHEAELVIELARDGKPVRDLALWLGAETHVAVWREDGEQFGHTHSYTPEMARMMTAMQGHQMDAAHSAAMMLKMMSGPSRLVYPGPRVPVRHRFPTAGRYRLFFQLAPGGESLVVPFVVDVVAAGDDVDTRIDSIVPSTDDTP